MGEVLLVTDIPRDKNKLYYCGTDKETGCVTVCSANLARHGKKKNPDWKTGLAKAAE